MKTLMNHKLSWQLNDLDLQLVDLAFIEDLGKPRRDVTTTFLFFNNNLHSKARIISNNPNPVIVCGLPVVKAVLNKIDDRCIIESDYKDGDTLQPGATLLTLNGPTQSLLMIERITLNFLQRLCAIATLTANYVSLISHTATKILDTRKTLPGFRHLEKYAVHCGGGVNHRMGLYDAIMIKDTHIDMLSGLDKALEKLPDNILEQFPVIIEVRTKQELTTVLDKGLNKVTRILLDNMSSSLISECVKMCNGHIPMEASGNINHNNILPIAQTGIDFVSIGGLTHSAGNVDLSMKCDI